MSERREACDVLFVSEMPLWPLDQGYRVHGCNAARALRELGLSVRIASLRPTPVADAPAWLAEMLVRWPTAAAEDAAAFAGAWGGRGRWLRERLASHQGVEPAALAGVLPLVRGLEPAAVVGVGLHAPMILAGLREAFPDLSTVWYAADEAALFQLSCMRREGAAGLGRVRPLVVQTAIERAFCGGIDGVIGVSEADTAALRRVTRVPHAETIANGVDVEHFRPGVGPALPRSLVFWGRMDFEPNADAAAWFAKAVWPALRERHPDATWRIVGKHPTAAVRRLHGLPGVEVTGEVADVRPLALAASATILPMRCGGGIKNKLLEAAAMARPILASPRALGGLDLPEGERRPLVVCAKPAEWVDALDRLWTHPGEAAALGERARRWVCEKHTWAVTGRKLLAMLQDIAASGPHAPAVAEPGSVRPRVAA